MQIQVSTSNMTVTIRSKQKVIAALNWRGSAGKAGYLQIQ